MKGGSICIYWSGDHMYYVNPVGGVNDIVNPTVSGEWYSIRIVLDSETDAFDLYLNDTLKLYQAGFWNPAEYLKRIEWKTRYSTPGAHFLDEVLIY